MKTLFEHYRPFLLFLGKFFSSYLLLVLVYRVYLASVPDDYVDGVTANVSNLVEQLSHCFGLPMDTEQGYMEYKIFYNGKFIARIIEGCNAISVIILFIAFIIAFSGKFKPTILYIIAGSFLIYFLNIFRIIVFVFLYQAYPEYEHFLHGVLFPAIIYGIVFLLWLYWLNKYLNYVSKTI